MKKLIRVHPAPAPHWVGNGFLVRSLFDYAQHGNQVSPFLLLDFAAANYFAPSQQARGVGQHPHRGFETVTIVYQGELAHRDSTGAGGLIGPGEVQWMTAGGGILHEEFHSPAFTAQGGQLEMVQLWVNLPAAAKMQTPGYQTLRADRIPQLSLPAAAGSLRIIAGEWAGQRGPAQTATPLDVWDLQLNAQRCSQLQTPAGHQLVLVVLHGQIRINRETLAEAQQWLEFSRSGQTVEIEALTEASLLWLAGEPIDEPIVGHGPFVMNSEAEIQQAMLDFRHGRFGRWPSPTSDS